MNFKKSLLIALFSISIAQSAFAETDSEKFDRAVQLYEQQQNYSAAFPLFRQLAEQGNVHAQLYLGQMYYWGIGVTTKDEKQYFYWNTKAADQEAAGQGANTQAYAQRNLGFIYMNGHGVRLDYSKAKHYFGLACDNGDGFGCKYYADLEKQGVR